MTPEQFVTAWMSLLDKGIEVTFRDDMRLYVCHISVHSEETDEWQEYEAAGDINRPNPVTLFEQAYADMKARRQSEQ